MRIHRASTPSRQLSFLPSSRPRALYLMSTDNLDKVLLSQVVRQARDATKPGDQPPPRQAAQTR